MLQPPLSSTTSFSLIISFLLVDNMATIQLLRFQTYEVASLLLVLSALLGIAAWIRRDRRLDKMPGPQGWPLIGIGLGLPPRSIFTMHQWALEHGEVFKLRVGWYNWVVLNSPQAVREILDKQVRTLHPR